MKNILKLLFPLLVLTACEDTIDKDHRYTPASAPEIKRSVLVEEYTGTKCVNCPNGHALLESLEEYYNTTENRANGHELIVVGIHIPNWGQTTDRGGFITPEAANLTPEGVNPPQAQVNRSKILLNRQDWSKAIAQQICRAPEVSFPEGLTATIEGSTVKVSGTVLAKNEIPDAMIHVWIVEDDITYRQSMPDGTTRPDYVHKNVYRAFMTPSFAGEKKNIKRNTPLSFSYSSALGERWNPANLRAIVFIETETAGVLNAIQTPVLP